MTNPSAAEGRSLSIAGRLRASVHGRRGALAIVTAALAIGAVHALIVAPHYHVGSFDDDGAYLLGAHALAAGHGLTTRIAGGYPLIGVYPPGYPALIAPLVRLWPGNDTVLRAFSFGCFLAVFPLTWVYLGQRLGSKVAGDGAPGHRLLSGDPRSWTPLAVTGLRMAVLLLLALNPVLATYATMVMPETSFVVVFLLLMLAVDRWSEEPGTLTAAGAATVMCAAALPWLKEAGLALVVGVAGWLLLRRQIGKAVLAIVGPAILLVPLLAARAAAGAALIGSRYSRDLGPSFQGGLGNTLRHVVPTALKDYVTRAIPKGLIPTRDGLLPNGGPFSVPWFVVTATVAPLVVVGYVVWVRRRRDPASVAVPLYLAETLVYPFINERRIVLVVPVVAAWYALGCAWLFGLFGRRRSGAPTGAGDRPSVGAGRPRTGGGSPSVGRGRPSVGAAVPGLLALLVAVALVGQVTRDYLYFEGASSSAPAGSPYMAFLRQAGPRTDVVETDYLWTTARYSGHDTRNGAYLAGCDPRSVAGALTADRAAFVLTAELNGGGRVDDDCLLPALPSVPGAVRLYRTKVDLASVYQLLGPGSPRLGWVDHTPEAVLDGGGQPVIQAAEPAQGSTDPGGSYPTVAAPGPTVTLTWSWPHPVAMAQLSLGAAAAEPGAATTSIQVSVQGTDGRWQVMATIRGAVGPDAARRFVLVLPNSPMAVTAARVTVGLAPMAGPLGGGSPVVAVHDLHVLGPASLGAGASG